MSKWEAMGQMLVTNQQMDKLAASHTIFKSCGMLKGTGLSNVLHKLPTLFNYTLIPLLTDKLIGQKQLMAIHADNSQEDIPMDDDSGNVVGNTNSNNDDDDDNISLSAPNVLVDVKLARTIGEYYFLPILTY